MEALVQELKSRYNDRYIILDATPLLATSEPEVLARLVDGIVIVVRAGVTPRETVKQAIASLDPKKIMGFVLNDVKFKSSGFPHAILGGVDTTPSMAMGKEGPNLTTQRGTYHRLRKNLVDPRSLNGIPIPIFLPIGITSPIGINLTP